MFVGMIESGSLVTHIDQTFPFTAEAVITMFENIKSGKTRGKLSLQVSDEAKQEALENKEGKQQE